MKDNKELFIKSLNEFGLTLNKNTTAIVYDIMDRVSQWESSYGGIPQDSNSFNSDCWQVLCTAHEYNQFVENLFSLNMDLKTLISLNEELREYFFKEFSEKYSLIKNFL